MSQGNDDWIEVVLESFWDLSNSVRICGEPWNLKMCSSHFTRESSKDFVAVSGTSTALSGPALSLFDSFDPLRAHLDSIFRLESYSRLCCMNGVSGGKVTMVLSCKKMCMSCSRFTLHESWELRHFAQREEKPREESSRQRLLHPAQLF